MNMPFTDPGRGRLKSHPAADIFPAMDDDQFEKLKNDISGLGLLEPIILFEDMILDGRHRYRACIELGIEPVFEQFQGGMSETDLVMSRNFHRRHLNDSQRAMVAAKSMEYHRAAAKQRQKEAGRNRVESKDEKTGQFQLTAPGREPGDTVIAFPRSDRTAAAAAAKPAGVSTRSVERADFVAREGTEQDVEQVENGEATVKAKEREVRQRKRKEEEKPKSWITATEWIFLDEREREAALAVRNPKLKFNSQKNDKIEWAQWSWNPVTGCLHNCAYCYARDIAEEIYPQKFEPSLVAERLGAPRSTKPKKGATGSQLNVFTCSMADLFGKWVPEEWILAVLQAIKDAPQWNFLMLTKFPQRLIDFEFPDNAWIGATVDRQLKVEKTEQVFSQVRAKTKFLSIEPMIESLQFSRLDLFQWIIVGGASKSTKTPEWVPPFDWLCSIHHQARSAHCAVYFKTNLKLPPELRLVELPWLDRKERKLPDSF